MKTRFKVNPADVIRDHAGPYRGEAVALWQWFVQRLSADKPSKQLAHYKGYVPYEWINGTSSINNSEPNPIHDEVSWQHEALRRVRDLLLHVGTKGGRGAFLARCGFPSWASLDRGFIVSVPTDCEFPRGHWFSMRGRRFKKSKNSCHSQATWVQDARLELSHDGRLWGLCVEYGYPHDSSTWYWRIAQRAGESLRAFSDRVEQELAVSLRPEPLNGDAWRQDRERTWGRVRKAAEGLFFDPQISMPFWEAPFADLLVGVQGGGSLSDGRIELTRARLGVLKRWGQQTIASQRRKQAKCNREEKRRVTHRY